MAEKKAKAAMKKKAAAVRDLAAGKAAEAVKGGVLQQIQQILSQ